MNNRSVEQRWLPEPTNYYHDRTKPREVRGSSWPNDSCPDSGGGKRWKMTTGGHSLLYWTIVFVAGPFAWPDDWFGFFDPSDVFVQAVAWMLWGFTGLPIIIGIFVIPGYLGSLIWSMISW